MVGERRLGGRPDAALRRVQDAPHREAVGGVRDGDQVGHEVFDFGALVELRAAEYPVGQRRADEDFFERSCLGVGAVEDGDLAVWRARLVQPRNLVGHELRLIVLRVPREADDLVARADRREQVLGDAVEVVGDDGVRRIKNRLRRAVVLLEQHDLSPAEVALELDDVANVGAAKGVNRLIGVANDRQSRPGNAPVGVKLDPGVIGHVHGLNRPGQLANERVLRVIRVLILVNENVPESPLVQRRNLRKRAEQVDRLRDEIVEVEGVRTPKLDRVPAEQLEEHDLGRVTQIHLTAVTLRIDELVLEPRDLAGDGTHREAQGVGLHVFDKPLNQRARIGRVVDGECGAEAELLGLTPQDAHARRVERRDPHALRGLAPHEQLDALAHLGRRLVGERDGQNLAGPQLAITNEARDAPRQHRRLTRAGTRDDQQCLRPAQHGRALRRVEPVKQRIGVGERGGGGGAHDHSSLGRAADAAPASIRPVTAPRGPQGRGRDDR